MSTPIALREDGNLSVLRCDKSHSVFRRHLRELCTLKMVLGLGAKGDSR
jgi:hypothetical protein